MERQQDWYQLTIDEVLQRLNASRSGLSETEAQARFEEFGPNELERKKKTPAIVAFLRQFLSPLIYVLVIAIIISLVVEHYLDAGVIGGVLLINAIIGYIQETRAEEAVEALLELAAPKVKTRRQNAVRSIPARELVRGDIILLETGDKVPTDARLIEVSNLKVNEATLTGESVATDKHTTALREEVPLADRKNMVHMGTIVTYGRSTAVVVKTGMATEIGQIAQAIGEIKREPTPLQKSIARISRFLLILFVFVAALLVLVGVLQGLGLLEIFLIAVAAAVSAIPEGLPAVVTVVLALGMRAMANRNAIIRKLVAVETLGASRVICTDKTGTLTLNEMTVREMYCNSETIQVSGKGYVPEGEFSRDGGPFDPTANPSLMLLLRIGLLSNDALLTRDNGCCSILGDPTEGALVVAAAKAGMDKEKFESNFPRVDEIPFQSERQYMATLHPSDGRRVVHAKGSPEKILALSNRVLKDGRPQPLNEKEAQSITETNDGMARRALRVIALAYADMPEDTMELEEGDLRGNLVFVGLAGMEDPPRQEAIDAVRLARSAGIKVVMITGDNKVTAQSIAGQLGLPPGKAITGSDLAGIADDLLEREVENISVYARVEPLQKLRIVNAFKNRGEVVAMTGDGVNDAPALRAASIGIAMGVKGTDVAKEASDMVLADDNFASIIAAVEEGRVIFNRLRNVLFFLLSTNIGELTAFLLSLIFVGNAPLVAVQIIWVNLVTDAAVGLPVGLEPRSGTEMDQPPRHPRVGLMYPGLLYRVAFLAGMMAVGVFGVFYWAEGRMSLEEARTLAFMTLVAFEWFRAFNARSDERTVFSLGLLRNRYLVAAIGGAILLQLAVLYLPFMQVAFDTVSPGALQWGIAVGAGGSLFTIEELRKRFAPSLFSRGKFSPAGLAPSGGT